MLSMNNFDFCVLIPILNEEQNISELIYRLENRLSEKNYLITFIDDGSTDKTVDIVSKKIAVNKKIILLQRQKTKKGCQRGGALFYGLKSISEKYDVKYWIEMDGDLSHQPEELIGAITKIETEKIDFLILSKYLKESRIINRSAIRNGISKINSWLFRIAFSYKITDYSNGYRLYNNAVANYILSLNIKYTTPIYLGEVLVYCLKNKFNVAEFASVYVGRNEGESSVTFSDIVEGFTGYFYLLYVWIFKK